MRVRQGALVAVVVVAAGVGVVGCGDDGRAETNVATDPGEASARYSPVPPPDGLHVCEVGDSTWQPGDPPEPDDGYRRTVWGDRSSPDPWRGPLAVVINRADPDVGIAGRPVRVAGRPGAVAPVPAARPGAAGDWGHAVTWRVGPHRAVALALRGGSAAETIRLAERVRIAGGDPRLPADALGTRTAPIRADATPARPNWSIRYATGDGVVAIQGDTTRPDDLRLAALFGSDGPPAAVAWRTGDGQTITVSAEGVRSSTVDAFAAGTRELTAGELHALEAASPGNTCPATG